MSKKYKIMQFNKKEVNPPTPNFLYFIHVNQNKTGLGAEPLGRSPLRRDHGKQ